MTLGPFDINSHTQSVLFDLQEVHNYFMLPFAGMPTPSPWPDEKGIVTFTACRAELGFSV